MEQSSGGWQVISQGVKTSIVGVLLCTALSLQSARADPPSSPPVLTVFYEDYPPYTYSADDGSAQGLIADRLMLLAAAVGADLTWQKNNYNRIVRDLWDPRSASCAAGYSLETFNASPAKIAGPLAVVSNDTIAIRAGDAARFNQHRSISDILADDTLRGVFIQGADYAELEKGLLGRQSNPHLFVNATDIDLGVLVARGRADYAMIDELQTRYVADNVEGAEGLTSVRVGGFPASRPLHLVCGGAIDAALWQQVEAAIARLFTAPAASAP